MAWQGVILEESLEDKSLLEMAEIVGTETDKLEEEDRVMTFHKVEISDLNKNKYLDMAVHTLKQGFYVHLCKDGEMYVVYKGVMFNFRKNFPQLEDAKKYGKSIGIIEEQMPFEHLIDHPFD